MCWINVAQPQNVHSISTTMTVSPPPVTVEDNNKVNIYSDPVNFFSAKMLDIMSFRQIHKSTKTLWTIFTRTAVTRL